MCNFITNHSLFMYMYMASTLPSLIILTIRHIILFNYFVGFKRVYCLAFLLNVMYQSI